MSSRSKAWLVAATIGAVEASKDQLGLCRWNYMIRSVNQRIRNNVRSATQANRFSSSSTTVVASGKDGDKAKKSEESLRTVIVVIPTSLRLSDNWSELGNKGIIFIEVQYLIYKDDKGYRKSGSAYQSLANQSGLDSYMSITHLILKCPC
ncbi:hypothetical protein Bca101_097102 [Brassica carinata]